MININGYYDAMGELFESIRSMELNEDDLLMEDEELPHNWVDY